MWRPPSVERQAGSWQSPRLQEWQEGLRNRDAHRAQLPLRVCSSQLPPPGAPQPQRWVRPRFGNPHRCTVPPAPTSPSQTPLPGASPAPELGKPFAGTTWLSSAALALAVPFHPGWATHKPSLCLHQCLANALSNVLELPEIGCWQPPGIPCSGHREPHQRASPCGCRGQIRQGGRNRGVPEGPEMAMVLPQVALGKSAAGAAHSWRDAHNQASPSAPLPPALGAEGLGAGAERWAVASPRLPQGARAPRAPRPMH